MMKRNKQLIPLLLLLFAATGCEKYLSVLPDDRTTINTTEKVSELLANAYSTTLMNAFVEPMTDNVDDEGRKERYERVNDLAYHWQPNEIDENRDSPIAYWVSAFKAIAVANQALVSIEALGDGRELREAKGEAYLIRAYYHFMLVNLWSEHYDPARANEYLGIPYVEEPETDPFKTYSRLSLHEVYARIEKDLLAGLSLVGKNYPSPKYRFTPEAAKAFAVRFYLYKGGDDSWPQVIKYANELLTNAAGQLRDWPGKYRTLGVDRVRLLYPATEDPANIMVAAGNSVYARTLGIYSSGITRFALSAPKYDGLVASNTNPFGLVWGYGAFQSGIGDVKSIWKCLEHFIITNPAAQTGSPYLQWVMFSYDEVLLARAEAYAMSADFAAARADMLTFFSKRLERFPAQATLTDEQVVGFYRADSDEFTPYYPLSDQQAAYVKAIASMRQRDFIHESLRWFDIKRFRLAITHNLVGESPLILAKDDVRRVMQIPPSAQDGGLVPNPR